MSQATSPQAAVRLAILIDAENVAAGSWPAVAAIAARFGVATVVRAYVCHPPTAGWAAAAGVEIADGWPADGPNAADFLLAMDAAVMAAEKRVDGFVLVTGDDGFAAVAQDLKRRGAVVYALVPLNGSAVPRRLAAVADLTMLIPPPASMPSSGPALPLSAVPQPGRGWRDGILAILAQSADDGEGWLTPGELGSAIKEARIKKPKGRLLDLVRGMGGVDVRILDGETWVCLRSFSTSPEGGGPFDEHEIPF